MVGVLIIIGICYMGMFSMGLVMLIPTTKIKRGK